MTAEPTIPHDDRAERVVRHELTRYTYDDLRQPAAVIEEREALIRELHDETAPVEDFFEEDFETDLPFLHTRTADALRGVR